MKVFVTRNTGHMTIYALKDGLAVGSHSKILELFDIECFTN